MFHPTTHPTLPWVKGRAWRQAYISAAPYNIIGSIPQLPALFCIRNLSFDLISPEVKLLHNLKTKGMEMSQTLQLHLFPVCFFSLAASVMPLPPLLLSEPLGSACCRVLENMRSHCVWGDCEQCTPLLLHLRASLRQLCLIVPCILQQL